MASRPISEERNTIKQPSRGQALFAKELQSEIAAKEFLRIQKTHLKRATSNYVSVETEARLNHCPKSKARSFCLLIFKKFKHMTQGNTK